MPRQVNEPDGGRDTFEYSDRLKTKPLLPARCVRNPFGVMRPMDRQIVKLTVRFGMHGPFIFKGVDMNLRLWEVRQTTRMIQVEMRLNDVLDILDGITQLDHLIGRCFIEVA